MTRNRAQLILSLLIVLMPALSFPHAWTYTIIVIMALGISAISVWNYLDRHNQSAVSKKVETYTENSVVITSDK